MESLASAFTQCLVTVTASPCSPAPGDEGCPTSRCEALCKLLSVNAPLYVLSAGSDGVKLWRTECRGSWF